MTKLAELQEKIIREGYSPTRRELKGLNNWWVKLAERIAPNNLVVRNICILSIINNNNCDDRLKRLINELCWSLWKEGYSYWLFSAQNSDTLF